jgi:hypothetical protein
MKWLLSLLVPLIVPASPGFAGTPPELNAALARSRVGDVVPLSGLDPLALEQAPAVRSTFGGKFVYSGSPEYCPGPGILYQDTFRPGDDVRLYLYHVNASRQPLRFSIVAEPLEGAARILLGSGLVVGPCANYAYAGQLASFVQLGRPAPTGPRALEVRAPVVLDPELDRRIVPPRKPELLIHSIHDFQVADGPVRISVLAVDGDAATLSSFPALGLLDRDKNHDRGTYEGLTRDVDVEREWKTTDGVLRLRLADGKTDPWPQGGDRTLGTQSPYRGAYGVIYRIHLRLGAPDGRRFAVLLNPRAGFVAGAFGIEIPGRGRTAYLAPELGRPLVREKEQGAVMAFVDPAKTPEVTLLWTPPGSSSLPAEFLLVPFSDATE